LAPRRGRCPSRSRKILSRKAARSAAQKRKRSSASLPVGTWPRVGKGKVNAEPRREKVRGEMPGGDALA
jgi:hypothetical protein